MDTTSRAFGKVRFLKMDSPSRGNGHHIQAQKYTKSYFLEWVHVQKILGRVFWGEKKRLRQDSQENDTFRGSLVVNLTFLWILDGESDFFCGF